MAQQNGEPGRQRPTETIRDNILSIERGSLIAGRTSFQIRNIVSLVVEREPGQAKVHANLAGLLGVAAAIVSFIVADPPSKDVFGRAILSVLIGAAFAATVFYHLYKEYRRYQLTLLTSAASSFRIVGRDEAFLNRLKLAIEDVMHQGDRAPTYRINIGDQKIEANTTNISGSPGAIVNAGSGTQEVSIVSQGLSDVSALIGLVEASNAQNAAFLKEQLEVVRSHLSGGRHGKADAKAAWERFTEQVGTIANAGAGVWNLVASLARFFA